MKMNWNKNAWGLGGILVALGVLFALRKVGVLFQLTASDWAAWVQAVGSIAAIVVSLQINRSSANEEIQKEREYPLRNLRVIAERAKRMINAAPNTLTEVDWSQSRTDKFIDELDLRAYRDVSRALHDFPITSLRDDHAVVAVFEMRLAMNDYCETVELIDELMAEDQAREAINDQLFAFEKCQDRFNLAMTQLQLALDGAGIR